MEPKVSLLSLVEIPWAVNIGGLISHLHWSQMQGVTSKLTTDSIGWFPLTTKVRGKRTQRLLSAIQLIDHSNVPWAVDIILLSRVSPRPKNYFKGSSRVKRLRKASTDHRGMIRYIISSMFCFFPRWITSIHRTIFRFFMCFLKGPLLQRNWCGICSIDLKMGHKCPPSSGIQLSLLHNFEMARNSCLQKRRNVPSLEMRLPLSSRWTTRR